jgi:uncharacterized protein YacL
MVVPHFVLNELQHIADSPELLRRNRGRRGLDILNRLQKESLVPVHITDVDAEELDMVDEKLVHLAKQLGCAILTNDFNLNRVAELQGVLVLNINDLANAVKTVYLPGEEMSRSSRKARRSRAFATWKMAPWWSSSGRST